MPLRNEREALQASHHAAVRVGRFATRLARDRFGRVQQLLADDSTLQSSDRRTEAEVTSATEGHVTLAVLAVETQVVGVVYMRRVSVCGRPEEHETVAGMEVESPELAASLYQPVVEVEGRIEPADFFHESRNEIAILAKAVSGRGVLREVPHHAADERRGRLTPCCEHRGGDTDRCVTRDTSVLYGRGEWVKERSVLVTPEVCAGAIQVLTEILEHLEGLCCERRQSQRVHVSGEYLSPDHRPGPEPREVTFGKTEQVANDARGDELGNGHEISGFPAEPLPNGVPSPTTNGLFQRRHGSGGKPRLKNSPMDGVIRLVSRGDDASSIDLRHREDGGLAGGPSHQDASEIGGEV